MKPLTISNLFHAIGKLEHATTQVAGRQAMTEEQAQTLLGMINLCTQAANVALDALPPTMQSADPSTVQLTHDQVRDMDATAGLPEPNFTLTPTAKGYAALAIDNARKGT